MAKDNLTRITKDMSPKGTEIPKGAKILSKDTDIRVEAIENGFLITRSTEVKYQLKDRTEYAYITKRWYSKDDPLDLNTKDKSVADLFTDDE